MIICDTHVLIYDALKPEKLSKVARRAIDRGEAAGELACVDVSLWEMAALFARSNEYVIGQQSRKLIEQIIEARNIQVLAISAEAAVLAAGLFSGKGDPADRLIAATALAHRAVLVTADAKLSGIPGLNALW